LRLPCKSQYIEYFWEFVHSSTGDTPTERGL
jgi:hypothetical protein